MYRITYIKTYSPTRITIVSATARAQMYKKNNMYLLWDWIITCNKDYIYIRGKGRKWDGGHVLRARVLRRVDKW